MINKYVPALTDLNLFDFTIADFPLFAKLKRLSLTHCSFINGAGKLLAPCAELKHLQLEWTKCRIDQTFSKLEEVVFFVYLARDDAGLEKFITLNLTLKKLSIRNNNIRLSPSIFQSIGQHMKKLNDIKLEDIDYFTDDHMIDLAKELPQLGAMHLDGSTAKNITSIGLRNMVGHAKMLSHLTLRDAHNIQIQMSDYFSMLKSVQGRSGKIQLEIKIKSNGDNLNVPEEVLLANREWLWIDEEIEYDDDYYYFNPDSDLF